MFKLTTLFLLGFVKSVSEDKELLPSPQYLEHLSFDFSRHKLPVAYTTYGAAVQLQHKFNLIPDVARR